MPSYTILQVCFDLQSLNISFSELRERCGRLIRENMQLHFTVLSSIVTTWINERCVQQTDAITETEWDALKRYITVYLQAAYQLDMINKDIKEWLVILMDNVYKRACSITDPNTLNEMFSILSAFFVILEFQPNRIPVILDLLKRVLSTPDEKMGNSALISEEIISLKRHCINLLLKLVTSLPTVIKEYVDKMLDVVISVAPMVTAMQKSNLVQVLCALSNVASGVDNQRTFLNAALQDVIEFFQGSEFKM
jgi:hypothetical protein